MAGSRDDAGCRADRRRAKRRLGGLLEPLETRRMLAVDLIKDINPSTTAYGTPTWLTDVNGTLYFNSQYKLWNSDGTAGGTAQVTNNVWDPQQLINLGGTLLFNSQGKLYQSNGTEAGTAPLVAGAMNPRDMVRSGSKVFFRGADAGGDELWVTDGTAGGTQRLKDINPGAAGSDPRGLIDVNGRLFFRADDGSSGQELWTSDGTAGGTVRVKDILAGSGSSGPSSFVNVGGMLYFAAYDGSHGYELWKSDGTELGTSMVSDIRAGSGGSTPVMLQNVGGQVMYLANDGTHGFELWKSDGTTGGTTMVRDLVRGSAGMQIDNLRAVGSLLFFTADDGSSGHELWKSDGTPGGTVRVKDIAGGVASSFPGSLLSFNGKLYFTANSGSTGQELFVSDGTENGTVLLKDVSPGSGNGNVTLLTASGSQAYFTAHDGTSQALWKTDGTPGGTMLVSRPIVASPGSSSMNHSIRIGSTVYFAANDGINGQELWKTDGTSAATVMVKDLNPGPGGTGISEMTSVNGTLYFIGNGTIWKSDGMPGGTVKISNSVNQPSNLTAVGNTVFFRGWSPAGYELWKTDGTDTGTMMVKEINTTTVHAMPESMVNLNGVLMFAADDGVHGFELWKSDGTAAGTVMVSDIIVGSASSGPSLLTTVGGNVFFRASNDVDGHELWKSDGTAGGTVMVKDIRAGAQSSIITSMFDAGGRLYLSANDGTHGQELWTTDGTAGGTVMLGDIYTGARGSSPGAFADVDGMLYFRADDGIRGAELWKSDGTVGGTSIIKDINTGAAASTPVRIVNVNGVTAFAASDAYGYRLWRTDGTPDGTYPIHWTYAWDPIALGNELIFHAWSDWADEPQKVNLLTTPALATSASSAPAPVAPTTATLEFDGTFRYFDISVRSNTPDFEDFGMTQMFGSYNEPYPTTLDITMADETQVRLLAQRAANANQPVMLDIEHWNVDNRGFSEGVVALNMDRLGQVVDWMHDERPDVKVGFAAIMPGGNYPAPAPGTPAFALWQAANDRRQELADKVDFLLPSINPFYADPKAWPTYARAVMSEARRYDKPVVAFMWMHYEFFDPNIILRPHAVEFWRTQLDIARELGDSMAFWDHAGQWIEDIPWWTVTRDFILSSDPLAPSTATGLSASVVEATKLRVTWIDNAYNESAYRIERRAWNESAFTTLAVLADNATSFTDSAVVPSSDYFYRVVAVGAIGDSLASEEAVGRVILAPATPANVSASALSSRRVRISWTESSQDVGGFIIERSINGGVFAQLSDVDNNTRSIDDTGLTPGTNYSYRVRAYNSIGSSPTSTSASATTPLNDLAIRAHWRFDNDTIDVSGLAHHGTLVGSPTWIGGTLGAALSFDGVDDRVTAPDSADFRFTTGDDFSLSAWVNLPSLPGRRASVLAKGPLTGPRFGVGLDATNRWRFSSASADITGPLATTGWTHLAAVQDGAAGTRKLYVNGLLVASGFAQSASGTGSLWIGGSESHDEFFAGTIDDVRVYGKALSTSHVAALALPFVTLSATEAGTKWTLRVDASGTMVEFTSPTETGFTRPIDAVAGVNVIGAGGNDALVLDNTDGDVLPIYAVNFTGGSGTDTLEFLGLSSGDAFTLDASNLRQGNRSVNFGATEKITLVNATVAVLSDLGAVDLSIESGATVNFATGQHLASLSITDANTSLPIGGTSTLALGSVLVTGTGTLDLADNDLIVNYTGASPIGTWTGVSYTAVQGMIASRRIRTSSATTLTALHVAEARDVLGLQGNATASWSNESVDATSVLVKYTYTGDANLDGHVDVDDFGQIDFHVNLNPTSPGQFNGDFNLDGFIDVDDYGLIDFVTGIQGPPL